MKKFSIKPLPHQELREIIIGGEKGKDKILLGRLSSQKNKLVYIDFTQEHVIVIVGKRGSGKSFTLGTLLEGFSVSNKKSKISEISSKRSILLFDTLNIFWPSLYEVRPESSCEELQKQYELLKKWNLTPEKINVQVWIPAGFEYDPLPANFKKLYLNVEDFNASDWADLLDVDLIKEPMGQLINELYQRVLSKQEPSTIDNLISEIDEEIESNYNRETIRAVKTRLISYSNYEVFKGHTPLKELIKKNSLSVVLLNTLPFDLRTVLISVIIRKLKHARSVASFYDKSLKIRTNIPNTEREKIENILRNAIPRVVVAIDEAQNVLPSGRVTNATRVLVDLVREGRNFGTSLIITTQQPQAVDSKILAQADILISHKLVVQKDIDVIKQNLKSNMPASIKRGHNDLTFDELLRDLDVGQALISCSNMPSGLERCIVADIRPRITIHGGFED